MANKAGNKIFLWSMLGLLCVGLVGFGAGGLSGNVRSIGTVGNKDIPVQSYANALKNQIDAFSAQIGTPLTFQQAQAIGLDQSVLSQMITARTLDNEASKLGISVGDTRVLQQVMQVSAFQGLDGSFSRDNYRLALQQNGLTEAEFEAGLREDTARTLFQGAIIGGVAESATYADAVVQYIGEQRTMTWATLSADALTAPLPAPTDADLQAYYDANPEEFTSPEIRQISYAWLTPEMIQDQVTVDDQAVQDLYQERIAEFVQPERRLVERLVFGDESQATDAKARLDSGEIDFDALVAERGLKLSDVDMGDVSKEQLDGAGDAVFGAAAGDVVGPFMSSLGPALFRMNAVLAAEEITFEEAEPDLRTELANQRARRVIEDTSDQITDLLAGGATIANLAEQTDLEAGQIDWSEGVSDGIAAYETFRTAAAVVQAGAFPELQELSDGGVFALQLDGTIPPALLPFDEVRDGVVAGWTAEATRNALTAQAETAATAISGGATFEDQGLTPKIEDRLTRRDFVEGTPPDFMTQVFTMQPGQASILQNGETVIIVRLDAITPPDLEDANIVAERDAVAERTASGMADDVFQIFSRTLQSQTDVSINQAAINAVHTQFN